MPGSIEIVQRVPVPARDGVRGVGRPPGVFRIGAGMAPGLFVTIAISVFALLVLAWWGATASGMIRPIFLPSPTAVWTKMAALAADGTLWRDASISLYRMAVGFFLASAMAIPIGILIGCFSPWEAAIELL